MISLFAGIASLTAFALPPLEVGRASSDPYHLPLIEAPSKQPGAIGKGGMLGGVAVGPHTQIGVGIFKSRVNDRDFPGSHVLGGRKSRKRNAGVGLRFSF